MVTNEDEGRETESDDGTLRSQSYHHGSGGVGGGSAGGRSRRKPAAPQWLNPSDWTEDNDKSAESAMTTINGVCVMNTGVFKPAVEEAKNGDWEQTSGGAEED